MKDLLKKIKRKSIELQKKHYEKLMKKHEEKMFKYADLWYKVKSNDEAHKWAQKVHIEDNYEAAYRSLVKACEDKLVELDKF